ncbi:hypothetical protein BPAE_0147g00050 [Botrytis paeoniae]|uniref:Uncharacterized protein n=1 Tax=Botrytis paeoniae TaxID=278948 RepID=A0A4Z1FJN2_9HELO|nr:hypothetical protein BPAE_0147g00050 [Botrytis paeoniae]
MSLKPTRTCVSPFSSPSDLKAYTYRQALDWLLPQRTNHVKLGGKLEYRYQVQLKFQTIWQPVVNFKITKGDVAASACSCKSSNN